MLRAQLDYLIAQIISQAPNASDIIFTSGKPIQAEIDGVLYDIHIQSELDPLIPWQVEVIATSLMSGNLRLYEDLIKTGSCDLSYALRGRGRFRVNIFSQRGSLAIVMRKLPLQVPTIDDLQLPNIFKDMSREKYGLILVTGATGTGKSTSLAALVNAINIRDQVHIVTLEDPIEFMHKHGKGVVNQRELGVDFDSYVSGLRAALRQAPKVILVGEIRDRATINIALEAAETGHLVLGTLHTSDTAQTVHRIIGMYELGEEHLIRGRLAESIKYIVSQRLMPKIGGGRVAAFEILVNNIRTRELILKGEEGEKNFYNILANGSSYGMVTFDLYLANLYQNNLITEEIAMLNASDKSKLGQMIDKIKAERGEKITDIEGLELDLDYEKRV